MPIALAIALRRSTPFLLMLALACAKGPESSPPRAADTAAETARSAAPAVKDPVGLIPLPEDKGATELREYRITLPMIQQWAKVQNGITAAMKGHPDALGAHATPPATVDAMIARMDSLPAVHGALVRSKMSAHDYVLTMIALNQAVQLFQRRKANAPMPPGVTPAMLANADFVGQNLAAVQQVFGSLAR